MEWCLLVKLKECDPLSLTSNAIWRTSEHRMVA